MKDRALPELSDAQRRRYARHLILPEVGLEGQRRLRAARVLLIGAGGLGSPVALYLAAAGVGTIGIVDFDLVDESNLQRQVLFGVADLGRPKAEAAAQRLRALDPSLSIVAIADRLTPANALGLVGAYDIVADGTDNFPTRYLVNDACVLSGKPNVFASVYRFEGQASVFGSPGGPCYRCLHPAPPPPDLVPSCAEAGVLGVLPGLLGAIQATEAIKLVLGLGDTLSGRLLLVDALTMHFREIRLRRDPNCAVCGDHPTRTVLAEEAGTCGAAGPSRPDIVSSVAGHIPQVTVEQLAQMRDRGEPAPLLLDVREPHEYVLADLPGAIKVPLGTLPASLDRVPKDRELVVYCRSGSRSANAVVFLRQMGYEKAVNLAGGVNAWAERIDPSMRKY